MARTPLHLHPTWVKHLRVEEVAVVENKELLLFYTPFMFHDTEIQFNIHSFVALSYLLASWGSVHHLDIVVGLAPFQESLSPLIRR